MLATPRLLRRRFFQLERLEARLTPTGGFVGPLLATDFALGGGNGANLWHSDGAARWTLDAPAMATMLTAGAPAVIALPHPDGGFARFHISEVETLAPELAAKYPQIKTFRGQGIDDPTAIHELLA